MRQRSNGDINHAGIVSIKWLHDDSPSGLNEEMGAGHVRVVFWAKMGTAHLFDLTRIESRVRFEIFLLLTDYMGFRCF